MDKIAVTPFVGVWIEIWFTTGFTVIAGVTPFVGVWIEISRSTVSEIWFLRHSLRGSVDWNRAWSRKSVCRLCHSLRGSVDWNAYVSINTTFSMSSLPSWECGLKCQFMKLLKFVSAGHSLRGSVDWNDKWLCKCVRVFESLPSWECGLKFGIPRSGAVRGGCHSLRGSVDWNSDYLLLCQCSRSHSLRGSVDWNIWFCTPYPYTVPSLPSWECGLKFFHFFWFFRWFRHSLRGSVDWNECFVVCVGDVFCHSLRGSVDWNAIRKHGGRARLVTPFVGVWIEIALFQGHLLAVSVTPFVGVWIEITCTEGIHHKTMTSLPSWECGLK